MSCKFHTVWCYCEVQRRAQRLCVHVHACLCVSRGYGFSLPSPQSALPHIVSVGERCFFNYMQNAMCQCSLKQQWLHSYQIISSAFQCLPGLGFIVNGTQLLLKCREKSWFSGSWSYDWTGRGNGGSLIINLLLILLQSIRIDHHTTTIIFPYYSVLQIRQLKQRTQFLL